MVDQLRDTALIQGIKRKAIFDLSAQKAAAQLHISSISYTSLPPHTG